MNGWYKQERTFAKIKGLDPDAEWLLDSNAARNLFLRKTLGISRYRVDADLPDPPFAFLLSPAGNSVTGSDLLAALDEVKDGDGAEYRFNMSEADRERLKNDEAAGALCDADFFRTLIDSGFARLDKSMRLSSAMPTVGAPPIASGPFVVPKGLGKKMATAFPDRKVVFGVIDDGFAIAHPRLRLADNKTRVASFWDQEAREAVGNSTVPFGRELLSFKFNGVDGLNDILDAYDGPFAEIYGDQALAEFYPKRRNTMPRNASHGTAVLDLAAGEEMGKGADSPVVAVKLPRSSVLDTSGAHLEFFLLEGVHHILSRAEMIFGNAEPPKVVIVASYGFFGGPLDGSSLFERALDQVIASHHGRVQIILPSGNGRLNRAHAVRKSNSNLGQVRKVDWRSPAGDRTPSVMEIWSDPISVAQSGPTVGLELTAPDGQNSASVSFTDVDVNFKLVLLDKAGTGILAEAVCDHPPLHPGRRRLMIWIAPTAYPPPDVTAPDELSPSGVWRVKLTNLTASATDLAIWIRRDDSLPGFPTLGRQSGIERDPPHEGPIPLNQKQWDKWDDHGAASVNGTISSIASGRSTVVTCGFGAGDERPASDAAGGPVAAVATGAPNPPTDPPGRRKGPDCLAPSRVTALRGIKAANFFGGAKVALTGTSLAAPLVGHWLASTYLSGTAQLDGRLVTVDAAKVSDGTMLPEWKPSPARGDNRFINQAMKDRTFSLDDIP
jgi:hypothetical protein